MGEEGKKRVSSFGSDAMIKNITALYQELIAQK
jgi:hypothetical protein